MRIRRITLRNYRGVDERTVVFEPCGVTIVQGPNEAGKSSLAEAIDLLFDELDSTAKQSVRSIKPVHRDAGSEVEAEIEADPYAFTYSKRFHKNPRTQLQVERPTPESWTGREAHERVRAILGETLDLELWRALRIQQGHGIDQAKLADHASLATALDRAAGGSRVGSEEESLFEAVREVCERYYTGTGKERKDLGDAAAHVDRARTRHAELEARLNALESDIERSARIARERDTASSNLEDLRHHADALDQEQSAVARESARLEQLEVRHEAAVVTYQAAERERQDRESRRRRIATLGEAATAQAQPDPAPKAFERAQQAMTESGEQLAQARRRLAEATATLRVNREDFDFRRDELDLAQLEEREARILEARDQAEAAEVKLLEIRVDEASLTRLEEAHLEAERAEARLESDAPAVRLQAEHALEIRVDGEPVTLEAGQLLELRAAPRLDLELPDSLSLQVRASTRDASLREAQRSAAEHFRSLLEQAAVADLAQARSARERGREAQRIIDARERALRENLRDLSLETFANKLDHLRSRVFGYPDRRQAAFPVAGDFDAARRAAEEAEQSVAHCNEAALRAEARHEENRNLCERAEAASREAEVERRQRAAELARQADELEVLRSRETDSDLDARTQREKAALEALTESLAQARRGLAERDPEAVALRADNAQAALRNVRTELARLNEESIDLRARLAERGEEGLFERVRDAHGELAHAIEDERALLRRARAAKLLYDTLCRARETARRSYAAPLRERIETLGRYVFGPDLQVELDEQLQVASRTLAGRTVAFRDLSAGAREQISLLARLAGALTVSEENGVPLILDDALGHTDPERLAEMGAVLSRAGRQCQIIVLTCVPERYRYVGDAKVIQLDSQLD